MNKDIIVCRHCNKELDKEKSHYKREDSYEMFEGEVILKHKAFNLDWYYCDKCYSYFSEYKGENSYSIKFDEESLDFFKRGHYKPMRKYRRQILQGLVERIEDDIEYVHKKDTYENNFSFSPGGHSIHTGSYFPFCFRYDYTFNEDKECTISIMWVSVSGYNDIYNRMEDKVRLIEYDFEELNRIKKEKCKGITWDFIAECMELTGSELQLILKNKTKTKLNLSQLGTLIRFLNIKSISGFTERDTDTFKSYWM